MFIVLLVLLCGELACGDVCLLLYVVVCLWVFYLPLYILPNIAIVLIVLLVLLCGELACGDVCLLFYVVVFLCVLICLCIYYQPL